MFFPKNGWYAFLEQESRKEYFQSLWFFLQQQYRSCEVYPPQEQLWNAFAWTDPQQVKVVILGQDPYHAPGQAMGLAFSVASGIKLPPSLRNIYRELQSDCGVQSDSGDLTRWARQGVFLLNTVLTVRAGEAGSHRGKGWERLTDGAIRLISEDPAPKAFLLWGNDARSKKDLIDQSRHLVLEAAHPSPLSAHRGFFGCRHFSQANAFLQENGREPVQW